MVHHMYIESNSACEVMVKPRYPWQQSIVLYCIVVLTRDCLADRTDCRSVRVADRIGKLSPIPATQRYVGTVLAVLHTSGVPTSVIIPVWPPPGLCERPSVALTERRTTAARACDFISTFASFRCQHQASRSVHSIAASQCHLPPATLYTRYTQHETP